VNRVVRESLQGKEHRVYVNVRRRASLAMMMISMPPRDTSPHQDSAGAAPSGTPPPAQLSPPLQTRGTQSHSALTPPKRPMLAPEGGPRPRVSA